MIDHVGDGGLPASSAPYTEGNGQTWSKECRGPAR